MNIRSATTDDRDAIEETARQSFRASYALSPQRMGMLVDERFAGETLVERIDGDDSRLFVAETAEPAVGDDISGFAEFHGDGALQWLHIHPEARGRGIGTALVERVEEELADEAELRARLLEQAQEGSQFLEQFGLHPDENTTREVGSEEFPEQVYTSGGTRVQGSGTSS